MKPLTMGSLFAGIGGFEKAGVAVGIRTKWASEIEPYALKVHAQHRTGCTCQSSSGWGT